MNGMDDLIAFIAARLDEAERTVYAEGTPPHGVIAWLTYREPDGSMGYATVAHGGGEEGPWIADGKELPAPASVLVVYDPARVLREVATWRAILAASAPVDEARFRSGFNAALGLVLQTKAREYSHHPDWRPDGHWGRARKVN